MCGIVCVKLAHSSFWDREDIFITHRVINKLEVTLFLIAVIFFRGCVPGWLHHHMLSVSLISRESCFSFILLLRSLLVGTNNRIHYGPMVVFVCLHFTRPHYRHYADVCDCIELLK